MINMREKKVFTKGNVVVNKIKVGDIHYEYEFGMGIKCEVITQPVRTENGVWTWESKKLNDGKKIEYLVVENFSHYGPNLYDYEAYPGIKYI